MCIKMPNEIQTCNYHYINLFSVHFNTDTKFANMRYMSRKPLWGATDWHTVVQDGMATTPYRYPFVEMEGTPAPSTAYNRHTIIPAHRSNSCVSADCTLSLAHDQDTTRKKATQTSPGCGVT
jgi:hypothetical protein